MTKSDKERIAVVEAMLDQHVKNSDIFRVEVKEILSTHDAKDQKRTDDIMDKISEMEKKFDNTYVQRKELWAVSSFIGFLVTLIGLSRIFITKQP
jgi:hypothetical protein